MCTLVLAWQALDAPVAVAANRDERLDRPAEPPGVYREDPVAIAPRDAEAGGTWIGITERGLFVGITNRWTDRGLDGDRSRGLLVGDLLARESAAAAAEALERELGERTYEGFNLVVADADDAVVLEWDGRLRRTDLDPGVHVVVNVGIDDAVEIPADRPEAGRRQAGTARALREALAVEPGERASAWLDRAGAALSDHEYGACVHGDGFGTRSSSLLALGSDPVYRFADGPPCRTPYEPVALERHI